MVKKKETEQPEVVQEQVEKPKPKKATKPKAEVKEPAKKTKKAAEPKAEETAKPKADEKAAVGISLIFKAPDLPTPAVEPKRGKRAQAQPAETDGTHRRVRSRRRPGEVVEGELPPNVVVKVRTPREPKPASNEPARVKGSTRLEAKKQRRREGRDSGRRASRITESEFLARREAVDRIMVVRSKDDKIQIGVLEDNILVEHYVAKAQDSSLIGNVYLGKVQNVLPSMEAAFVDIGRGRNAVLYSGEVDWELAEVGNQPRKIELALKSGDKVLVQVTKDPVGQKGARLTSQISLPGRYLVYVPNGSVNGISRKLPESERVRLKKILKEILPAEAGVIVRTAAEGATEEQLAEDVQRLQIQWEEISRKAEISNPPSLLSSEPDLLIKIVRDVFNEDFQKMIIDGDVPFKTIEGYLKDVAPDLLERVERFEGSNDAFDHFRINEQIIKALDRKVYLPSGGSLVIDRTEAMTVVDVNTGKFIGSGGNLEETVTKNNLEAAEEIVRQLRLRDIGGIIVVDFIDMVLESNRELVLRRLIECLSRDRTKHQVAEVTSLGLVQMTRKKIGIGLLEAFSEPCEVCAGRGVIVHHHPVLKNKHIADDDRPAKQKSGKNKGKSGKNQEEKAESKPAKTKVEPTRVVTAEKAAEARDLMSKIAASSMVTPEKTLDNVLEALPKADNAPKKPKSRRVSSAGQITPGENEGEKV
ncbi:MAG: Rne/Rng family ribonuclease [Rhodoluna sp.]|jgi:ribonuclease E